MSEKMIEQFEAWLRREYRLDEKDDINFNNPEVAAMLKGWQASRAAVAVELPARVDTKPYACYEGGWNDMHDEAREAIEAQGLKVAP
ncbi:hypothetical protein [Pseudomonas sp. SMN5]|uniref:hypothetical protein n=1 Tax=Pseudomonas sp. SMN5 TaxID=3390198 RepID=UPI003F83BF09